MIQATLVDIEGTTTPIDFVHKTLFPYAKQRLAKYVEMHFDSLHEEIVRLADEHAQDASSTLPLDPTEPGSVTSYLEHLIDIDRKSTALKSIQGKIWEGGYESGELVSEVFDDVRPAFERWKLAGKTIAIYSSGSVLAQQLLFRYTNHGDLTTFISQYFDTESGGKRETTSYLKVSESLGRHAGEIVFLSDVVAELDAARSAGYQTCLLVRPGNEPSDPGPHDTATSFDGL